jgi:hypothetical protein
MSSTVQHPTPKTFVNIHWHAAAQRLEAHDGVYTAIAAAAEAAEQYADSYRFTLTEFGRIDLTDNFSEAYQEARDFDATIDAHIDAMKETRGSARTTSGTACYMAGERREGGTEDRTGHAQACERQDDARPLHAG